MIVQCTSCKARFRIADEKVPERGAKVRCPKCATVFRAMREGTDPPPELEGAEARPAGPGTTLAPTASSEVGAAIDRAVAALARQPASADAPHHPPTPIGMMPAPQPVAPQPSPPTVAMRGLTPTAAQASEWNANALDAALDAALTSAGVEPSALLPSPHTVAPLPVGGLTPPVERTIGGLPPLAPPGGVFDPFASQPPSPMGATPAPGPPPPFVLPAGRRSTRPPVAPAPGNDIWAELANREPREETDPFADLGSPLPAPPPPPPAKAPADTLKPILSPLKPRGQPPAATFAEPAPPTAADPGRFPTSAREIELREASIGQKLDLDFEGDPGLPAAALPAEQSPAATDLGRFAPARAQAQSGKTAVAPPRRWYHEAASAMLNVLSAAFILYAGIVAIAVIRTPRTLRADDLGFPMVWLALGNAASDPADQVRTGDIHSGIYPVNTGDDLFYVEGQAENVSAARHEAMSVSLEILRDSQLVQRADAVVGLHANPEDLYDLSSRKNEELQRKLATLAATFVLEPHQSAPFIAVFALHAADVAGSEIRAVVHDGLPPSLRTLLPGRARHPPAAVPAAVPTPVPPAVPPVASAKDAPVASGAAKLP